MGTDFNYKQPTINTSGSSFPAYLIWISFFGLASLIAIGCIKCKKKFKAYYHYLGCRTIFTAKYVLNIMLPLSEKQKANNDVEKGINQEPLLREIQRLKEESEFLDVRFYRVDLTLDPKTAHPRLEVSEDGKSVWDTGNIHDVSKSKERFESHTFVLAKQGFSEGRYYWEVEVGQKKMWDLGVASESAPRTGKITLSPQNGYWVIGCDGGKDYWARTDPWTSLDMPRKPIRIAIFLNTKSHKISFYDAERKHELYTFLNIPSGKFYPFFSTGSVITDFDNATLKIPPWFEE